MRPDPQMLLVHHDEVVLNVAEVLEALVCLHYLGRLDNKRCWRCKPCLFARLIDGGDDRG